jgi:hypothetical protein
MILPTNIRVLRLILFLFLALIAHQGSAQSVPPAYEIKNDTLTQQNVPVTCYFLKTLQAK